MDKPRASNEKQTPILKRRHMEMFKTFALLTGLVILAAVLVGGALPAEAQPTEAGRITLNDPTPQASAFFGSAAATIGDVNRDGVPDVVVGAPSQNVGDNEGQGRAFIFSGQ